MIIPRGIIIAANRHHCDDPCQQKKAFQNSSTCFLPYLADLPLRDQREMMERPFFFARETQAGQADRIHSARRQTMGSCEPKP